MYMYICVYVCVCVYIYIYIYINGGRAAAPQGERQALRPGRGALSLAPKRQES